MNRFLFTLSLLDSYLIFYAYRVYYAEHAHIDSLDIPIEEKRKLKIQARGRRNNICFRFQNAKGSANWRREHPDKHKASAKSYYDNNSEDIMERVLQWRRDNPDKVSANNKTYRKKKNRKNIAARIASAKEYDNRLLITAAELRRQFEK